MLRCPMCKKTLADHARQCPRCATDLSLLVDYVAHLEGGLERAEALTRQGQLGEAVWAYLAVLEVDPDNPTARRQVGQVATAVRQFDQASPARRWLDRLRRRERFNRWLDTWKDRGLNWPVVAGVLLLVLAALAGGFFLGYQAGRRSAPRAISAGISGP